MSSKSIEEVAVRVTNSELQSEASFHYNLYGDRPILYRPEALVHNYYPTVIFTGECLHPEKIHGHTFIIHLEGYELSSRNLGATLDDFHKRDEYGRRLYRTYRGEEIPILSPPPKGVGTYDKVRGEPAWEAHLWMGRDFVRDVMAMMAIKERLYVYMDTYTENRTHWIRSLTVTSINPMGDLI